MLILDTGVLNLDEAAKSCNVINRTLLLDLKVLEAAGIPLYKPNEANANYRLEKDFRFFHYQVPPKEDLFFLLTTASMLEFFHCPLHVLTPIQKQMLEFARKQKEKRREIDKSLKDYYTEQKIDQKHLFSMILQGKTSRNPA